jgi:hypothetical protein
MSPSRTLRRWLTLLILLISLSILLWGLLPLARETQSLLIAPADVQLPTPIGLIGAGWGWA